MLTQDQLAAGSTADAATEAPASAAVDATSPAATTSGTTNASGDAGPNSLFEAVRAVLPDSTDEGASPVANQAPDQATAGTDQPAPNAATPAGDGGQDTATQDTAELTAADLADVQKPSVRKRLEKLLEQRTQLRAEAEAYKPEADAWRQYTRFLADNNVTAHGQQQLFGVVSALGRGDFSAFLDAVRPYVDLAERATGARLTPDMQRQVDDGLLPEDTARELARARTAAAVAQADAQRARDWQQQQQVETHSRSIHEAAATWEQQVRGRDPDYALKADAVVAFSRALVAERGVPRTPQEAVAYAQDAYQRATDLVGRGRPAPQPTRATPNSAHLAATQGSPEPRSLEEAINAALGRR